MIMRLVRRQFLQAAAGAALLMTAALFAASIYWDLPVLLIVVSLVYAATRYDEWDLILNEAVRWGARLAGFLLAVVLVLFLVAVIV